MDQPEPLGYDELLAALRAVAEPSRLRIALVLQEIELTVAELCTVVAQSQSRVSRHLAILCDAGILERRPQGRSAFYRPSPNGAGRRVLWDVVDMIDLNDAALTRDQERLEQVRTERAERAAEYFETVAASWDNMRLLHVSDIDVEQALVDAVDDLAVEDLLDVGTGTGRILELFANRISRGIGIDLSPQMLNVARSHLDAGGFNHCTVRHGNIYDLDLNTQSIDVAVMHHVLHFLDDPATAIGRTAATLRPNGRLLVVDFAPHEIDAMRSEFAHHWLGFDADTVNDWCHQAGLETTSVTDLRATEPTSVDGDSPDGKSPAELVVRIWVAQQPTKRRRLGSPSSPTNQTRPRLEVAS